MPCGPASRPLGSGGRVTDISHAVETTVRARGDYGILEDYVGHGIGTAMHLPPDVPNVGRAGRGPKLVPGLALAVEPMVTLGSHETEVLDDDWTVATADGSCAAHFEHTFTLTAARRMGADRARRRCRPAGGARCAVRRGAVIASGRRPSGSSRRSSTSGPDRRPRRLGLRGVTCT